jgi:hypothetical protein
MNSRACRVSETSSRTAVSPKALRICFSSRLNRATPSRLHSTWRPSSRKGRAALRSRPIWLPLESRRAGYPRCEAKAFRPRLPPAVDRLAAGSRCLTRPAQAFHNLLVASRPADVPGPIRAPPAGMARELSASASMSRGSIALPWRRCDPGFFSHASHCLRPARKLQFIEYVMNMMLHRRNAHAQFRGDLLVR